MATPAARTLDLTFAALSDSTRRRILRRLRAGEASVGELAEPLKMSLPAVSKHLRVLETAGLLSRRIEGRNHYLSANPNPLRAAMKWIESQRAFWEGSFDRLAAHLEASPSTSTDKSNRK